jgi:atypical dual specificity phosphatase
VLNFSWVIEGRLAGMACPEPADAERLREMEMTAIVSLSRKSPFRRPPEGISVLHLPVADMTAPAQEQLLRAVRFLDVAIGKGGRAAVHCVAGYGRTGTVLAAYLVSEGAEPEEAIHRVRKARPGSVETVEQEHAVHRFAETWAKAAKRRKA